MSPNAPSLPVLIPPETIDRARDQIVEANQRFVALVRRNPGTSLIVAAAAGYLIGRVALRMA